MLLYYVPRREHLSRGDLAEVELEYAFEREITTCRVLGTGPDGGKGVVACDPGRAKVGYFPDKQDWKQIPGNPAGAWVGRSKGRPILPADLARREQLSGHPVTLVDGQEWIAPVARMFGDLGIGHTFFGALPAKMDLNPEGLWVRGEILECYQGLFGIGEQWWAAFLAIGKDEQDPDAAEAMAAVEDPQWQFNAAATALGANYRIGGAEIALLGLFEEGTPRKILGALIDLPNFEDWLKKNRQAGDSASAG